MAANEECKKNAADKVGVEESRIFRIGAGKGGAGKSRATEGEAAW